MAQRFAFLVACNDYQHLRPLNFCIQDAELLKETLTEWCDYAPENVVLEEVTLANPGSPIEVLAALQRLVDSTADGDTILFYFAGHGGGQNGNAYLSLPATRPNDLGSTGISLNAISDVLRKSRRLCVRIFDACHSGVDTRSDDGTGLDYPSFARALEEEKSPELNWVTLASCRHHELSYEDPDLGHGVFTQSLSDAIREVRDDTDVEALPLFNDVYKRVVAASKKKQRAQNPVANSHLSGLGVIAKRIVQTPPISDRMETGTVDFMTRLSQARESQEQLISNRVEELAFLPTIAGKLLQDESGKLNRFEISSTTRVGSTNLIPGFWQAKIVRQFEQLGVRSLHSIRSYTSQRNQYSFLEVMRPPTIEYSVEGAGWPNSVALLEWDGDKFLPSGTIMCYFIPLETKIYAVVWLTVQSFIDKESKTIYTLQRFGTLEEDWQSILLPAIREALDICIKLLVDSGTAYLDYIDRERLKS